MEVAEGAGGPLAPRGLPVWGVGVGELVQKNWSIKERGRRRG